MGPILIQPVTTARDRRRLALFPWQIYKGDPNWVPPLIAERLAYLDPGRGPFYQQADVALFLASRDHEVLGTIAAFVDHRRVEHLGRPQGGFGFFEVIEDLAVAQQLLDAACQWLRERGMTSMRGPTNFTELDCPGVLIEATDCPPAILEAHTPLYYSGLLERYGMEKEFDTFAWRAPLRQLGADMSGLPPEIARVASAVRRMTNFSVRKVRLQDWDREVSILCQLFNVTLRHIPDYIPVTEAEFRRFADEFRALVDPDLALIAEVGGQPVGFCVALPDANRVLIHLNGRLFPLGWLKARFYMRKIEVVSFKLLGVLEEYRRRGIDAVLYVETLRAAYNRGYAWLDGSLSHEFNPLVGPLAQRLGAERYKHYRLYQCRL